MRERPLIALPKVPGELELQARWFAGDFGRNFTSTSGEPVELVQFGYWNREPGPDFRGAALRKSEGEVQRGGVEIDLLDRNWESHGHAINPAFEETILHVFVERSGAEFFTRTSSHWLVPQVQLDLGTLGQGAGEIALAHAGRCVAPLRHFESARVHDVLDSAARFRLQRKAEKLRRRVQTHGREDALFHAVAEALGYKQNRLPFTLLAQRLPLAFLRENVADAEAVLFGIAGFLEAPNVAPFRTCTRSYVRSLWDKWWRHRDRFARLILPPKLWKTSGARPLNHPHRRLGALAALLGAWKRFSVVASRGSAGAVAELLSGLHHPFWSVHYTLFAEPAASASALIGESRIADILANVIYPLRLSEEREVWNDYRTLRAQLSNQSVRIAAARLFADDPRQREFLRLLAAQQGLLQIYEDFCLRDASDCAQCPFPEQVRKW
ncbi:MAG: DUF2851 family protein [Verrucomicrobia bacterium]|nr:DUF2851 family protein [Verrucomicrobiota bacterium]